MFYNYRTFRTKMSPKVAENFKCDLCNYICCKQSDLSKHVLTRKHQYRTNRTKMSPKVAASKFTCYRCNKEYTARNSLWYHEKKCCEVNIVDANTNIFLRDILLQNRELMDILMTHNKDNGKSTIINQTTNNNNQRFNINVFLNETCKDAINFSDFIKNINISYEDLENNAQLGFVSGISKIFIDNLKQIGINERPIHCTDAKRETMYIKDDNIWTKQQDDEKLQKAIQTVSYRSMGKLAEWKQENPDYKDCNSDFSQKCLDIHRHTLAGNDREVYYPKVIHVVARETKI